MTRILGILDEIAAGTTTVDEVADADQAKIGILIAYAKSNGEKLP
jgi:hypothetical protein